MNTLIIILLVCGIVYLALFNRPNHDTVPQLKNWFSSQLVKIAGQLEQDIQLDKQGQYPHRGRQSFEPRGSITYTLVDKGYSQFDISEFNDLAAGDIESTDGYLQLKDKAERMRLFIRLDEIEVEGDGVSDYFDIDEYIHDIPRFYTVTVSGWSSQLQQGE